jgi:hypothetical protein
VQGLAGRVEIDGDKVLRLRNCTQQRMGRKPPGVGRIELACA